MAYGKFVLKRTQIKKCHGLAHLGKKGCFDFPHSVKVSLAISVTRFGENLPILAKKIERLWTIFRIAYLVFGKILCTDFGIFILQGKLSLLEMVKY